MGRPKKWTYKKRRELLAAFLLYIETNDIPVIAQFAYLNKVPRQKLYEFGNTEEGAGRKEEELAVAFRDALKMAVDKKEAMLEVGTLAGKLNPAMAIFSLKQLGWKDRQEVAATVQGQVLAVPGMMSADEWAKAADRFKQLADGMESEQR